MAIILGYTIYVVCKRKKVYYSLFDSLVEIFDFDKVFSAIQASSPAGS